MTRWSLGSALDRSDDDTDALDDPDEPTAFYRCMHCHAAFDEWIESCPDCDQLVVRVVDRPGVR